MMRASRIGVREKLHTYTIVGAITDKSEYATSTHSSQPYQSPSHANSSKAQSATPPPSTPFRRRKPPLPRAHSGYRSSYLDLCTDYRSQHSAERTPVNDDVVFKIELTSINAEENLCSEAAHTYAETAFRDRKLRTTGTDITKTLPPTSRFATRDNHAKKKHQQRQRRATARYCADAINPTSRSATSCGEIASKFSLANELISIENSACASSSKYIAL